MRLPSRNLAMVVLSVVGNALVGLPAYGADVVRNGGDIIQCAPAPGAALVGPYIADYVVGASTQPGGPGALTTETFNETVTRLKLALPVVGDELEEYAGDASAQIWTGPEIGRRYVWTPASLGLLSLDDQHLMQGLDVSSPLPDNCYTAGPTGRAVQLLQVVIREATEGTRNITFNFDPTRLALIETNDRQMSFLLMHEWLWGHAENAVIVRNINWFLHTQAAHDMAPLDLVNVLSTLGFRFYNTDPGPAVVNIGVTQLTVMEPNGRPRFTVPDNVVVGSGTQRLVFDNSGSEHYTIRLFPESGAVVDLCPLPESGHCEIAVTSIGTLPTMLSVQREPLSDPIWDVKQVQVVQ